MDIPVSIVASIGFGLTSALDSGRYGDISTAEVQQRIEDGTVFAFLEQRLSSDIDLSLLYNDDRAELLAEWRNMANAIDTPGKFGVQHNGLCLLLAYVLEGMQSRARALAEGRDAS